MLLSVNLTFTSLRNSISGRVGGWQGRLGELGVDVFADFHTLPPRGVGCQLRVSTVPASWLDLENY